MDNDDNTTINSDSLRLVTDKNVSNYSSSREHLTNI